MKLLVRLSDLLILTAVLSVASFAGQFGPVSKYKIGSEFVGYSVALGDFNGDGVLDIATSSLSGFVWIMLGNGDGTFQTAKPYDGSDVAILRGIATADFNRDGKLDLATASADSDGGALNILLGNGDGTFQKPVYYPAGIFPTAVAVVDFNRDGNLDIAVMSTDGGEAIGGVSVLLGNGDGTFKSEISYAAGVNRNSITVADFNADGFADISTGTAGGVVPVLLGNGDGTFQKAIRNPVGMNSHYVGVGDFNNDGKVDLITTLENTTTQQNKVVIALGNGDGTLQSPITIPSPPKSQVTAVADFDRDGFQDIVIGAPKAPLDGIYLLLGQGNAKFVHEGNYATGSLVPAAIAVGDLNGDGYPDLVVLDGGDSVEVLLNTGASR